VPSAATPEAAAYQASIPGLRAATTAGDVIAFDHDNLAREQRRPGTAAWTAVSSAAPRRFRTGPDACGRTRRFEQAFRGLDTGRYPSGGTRLADAAAHPAGGVIERMRHAGIGTCAAR